MKASPAELILYDAKDTIAIRPFSPNVKDQIICTSWDLGAPDVRITNTVRPGQDGTDDSAGFLGARTVTLELVVMGSDPYTTIDRLAAMSHPSRRPNLQLTRAVGGSWTMGLRGIPFSITYGPSTASKIEFSMTFSAPLGYLEGALKGPYTAPVGTSVAATDWHFPAHLPKGFGPGSNTVPTITLQIGGSLPVSPILYISGPVYNPSVSTDDGEKFAFTGMHLVAGQVAQIDMGAATIRTGDTASGLISDDQSLYQTVDFTVSSFWSWLPGKHVVRYQAATGGLAIQYRERRLNL